MSQPDVARPAPRTDVGAGLARGVQHLHLLAPRVEAFLDGRAPAVVGRVVRRVLTVEVLTFLAVGGAGYVVDVVAFNVLRSTRQLGAVDPSYARVLAVVAAMVVTYLGNRLLTWRGRSGSARHRELGLFVLFNLVGLGLSVVCLLVSHDLLGLTTRLDDNVSANVVGMALGTLFRYWSYQRFVFTRGPVTDDGLPGERELVRAV